MTTSTTIPVTVTPEAAARIAHLGIQAEVDRMIEHARAHLPEVERIEVILYDRYELGDQPGLSIDVYSRHAYNPAEHDLWDPSRWEVTEFPPEVLEHVLLDYHPGAEHAG